MSEPSKMTFHNSFQPSTEAQIKAHMFSEMEALMGEVSPEFLAELAPMFLEDAPPLMATLETAVAQKDLQTVCDTAHTLKGSSSSMGIKRLAQIASEMEKHARQGRQNQLPIYLDRLHAEYAQVTKVLRKYSPE